MWYDSSVWFWFVFPWFRSLFLIIPRTKPKKAAFCYLSAHPRFTINNSLKTYYPAQIQVCPQWPPTLSSQLLSLNLRTKLHHCTGFCLWENRPSRLFSHRCAQADETGWAACTVSSSSRSHAICSSSDKPRAATRESVRSTQQHPQTRMSGHRSKPHGQCFEDPSGGPLGCRTVVL